MSLVIIKLLIILLIFLISLYVLFLKSKEKFNIIADLGYNIKEYLKRYGYLRILKNLFINIIYQKRISNFRTKLMHFGVFFGVLGSLFSFIFFIFSIKIYNLLLDIFILFLLIGIVLALARRYLLKIERIVKNSVRDNYFLSLLLLFLITINSFLIQGTKFALFNDQFFSNIYLTSNLSFSILNLFIQNNFFYLFLYNFLWVVNNILIFSFIYSLSKTKMVHMILAPISVLTSDDAYGNKISNRIELIDLESTEKFGIDNINDLNNRDLLEVFSCTECGRCQDVCPAFLTFKPLSPKSIIVNLLEYYQKNKNINKNVSIVNGSITFDAIWSCTTCAACVNACPVFINPLNKIIRFRQNLVMDKSNMPNSIQEIFNSIEFREHPFKGSNISKKNFFNKLKDEFGVNFIEDTKQTEYLYFLGCATIYNERAQNIAINLIKILKKLNIDFAISFNETCNGDIARRTGNEYLFQLQALNNINNFKQYKFNKILVNCAHCFNIFKNEYPLKDFNYEVIHHSFLLSNLIKEGKLKVKKEENLITYHDACYLGRHNNIYDFPRDIVKKVSNYKELVRNRENSFCCGAGGGMYFIEDKNTKKINHERFDEVLKINAKIVSTSCPYCLMMFEDAINSKGFKKQIIAKDIVEFIQID